MSQYMRELNNIYNIDRETAAMLMICKRLDRVTTAAEKLAACVDNYGGNTLCIKGSVTTD